MAEQSMFGVIDPELIQQAIAAEKEKGMLATAKLTPDELMRYTAMSGSSQIAQGLGGLVGSLFGVEVVDPRVKKAQQAQSIINEVNMMGLDPNSPDYMTTLSKIAITKGLPDLAQLATSRAQEMQKSAADIQARQAQTQFSLQQIEESKSKVAKTEYAMQQDEKLRAELSALPANATEEQILGVYRKYGSADQQSKAIQASLDRRARLAEANKPIPVELNNNGIPMGKVDAKGNFFDNSGRKVANKEFVDAEQSHSAAVDLLSSLRQINEKDINSAFGSLADYTQSDTAKLAGSAFSPETQKAQYKINQVGVKTILENLQKLKGASTDKEMQKVASTFPGFQARPEVMKAWMDDAIEATNRFLRRSEKRYGFDTVYEEENRFGTKGIRKPTAAEVPSAPSGGWKILGVK